MKTERLDLFALHTITFEEPDEETFRGLPLARRAMREGGTMPTVYNAANEAAVSLFLERRISFTDIWRLIEASMDAHSARPDPSLKEILEAEAEAREFVRAASAE